MNRVILTVKETENGNNAGPKAKNDVEGFLLNSGFKKWNFTINQQSILQKIKTAYVDIPLFLDKQNNVDEIFMQYPTYSKIVTKQLIKRISQMNVKLILIIHDVESLRLHFKEKNYIRNELNLFNIANGLIVHNKKMKDWLLDNGVTVPMEILQIFDYANNSPLVEENNEYWPSVCFAGNLNKAKFLGDLSLVKTHLDVFGPNPLDQYSTNISYKGQYSPDELPNHLRENFGLVWDGSTSHTCNGIFGNYMKFNDPHKASLYLSTGIPIIIWKEAALANFIKKEGVGITIKDLNDLDDILGNLSLIKYKQLVKNTRKIAQRLRKGFYINKAVHNLESKLVMEASYGK